MACNVYRFSLGRGLLSQIAWWMLDLWFGLDASGFEKACEWLDQSLTTLQAHTLLR